jgi:transposase
VLSEKKRYRKFSPQQKLELAFASLRGQMSVAEICREHQISETLLRRWREQLLEGGVERFAGKEQRAGERDLRRKIRELERALSRKTYDLEVAGEALRGWE